MFVFAAATAVFNGAVSESGYGLIVFGFNTLCAAVYEELLYRLYTPNRLRRLYTEYIAPRLHLEHRAEYYGLHGQKRFGWLSTSALCFTEVPALVLFAFAHRYLGFSSILFAAGAGVLLRVAYYKLERLFSPIVGISIVAGAHGLWNIGVYWYLWETL